MANLNKTALDTQIQSKIDVVSNTTSAQTIHQLASTVVANTGTSVTVKSISDLPNIYSDNVPVGTMVYVEGTQSIYIAGDSQWLDLEGKVARADYNVFWSWGSGVAGLLADGTTVCKSSPVSVIGGFTDWTMVASASNLTIGLRKNGTIWATGSNQGSTSIGDNTLVNKCSPVSVVGGFTDWCKLSATGSHTLALRTNGSLWAWGNNYCGKLGIGTGVGSLCRSPVSVIGGFIDWCEIAAGGEHSTAIRRNGTLWSWGGNGCGKLGDGTTVNKSSPVSVVGGFTDWCQVSAGGTLTAAVRTNGTLWTWGCNSSLQLGDGTTQNKSSPVSVIGGFTDWCQVSAGQDHTVAVRTNGTLWAWGCGAEGRLGINATTNRSSPVSVVGGFTDWCQVSAGEKHTAAVRTNGSLWTWGCNTSGQLGTGTTISRSSPVSVIGGKNDWSQVSAGYSTTVAI